MASHEPETFEDPFDRLIDQALRSEPLRQPSSSLFLEIQGRVRVAAVVQRVRRRLAVAAFAWLTAGGATALAVVAAARGFGMDDIAANAFPGMIGYADYLTSFYAAGGGSAAGAAGPVAAALGALGAAMAASWFAARRVAR